MCQTCGCEPCKTCGMEIKNGGPRAGRLMIRGASVSLAVRAGIAVPAGVEPSTHL
jgi:hypothetical protein